MSNTSRRRKTEDGSRKPPARRRLVFCLLTSAFCLLSVGCRMDMQDQPRYEAYERGDEKYFRDGKASRQLIEGTVPRVGPGRPYVDVQNDYLYTGRAATTGSSLQPGAQRGATGDAGGSGAGGAQGVPGGNLGVRANVPPGGAPSAATGQGGPDVFPMPVDAAALERGQERFNVYCSMCHGLTGEGDGMIVRRGFRKPPSFYEDRLQEPNSSAAHLFDVISNGWGAMPSYSDMIPAEDRWKIIAYVRALQLTRRVPANQLPPDQQRMVQENRAGAAAHGAAAGEGGEGQPGQGDKNH